VCSLRRRILVITIITIIISSSSSSSSSCALAPRSVLVAPGGDAYCGSCTLGLSISNLHPHHLPPSLPQTPVCFFHKCTEKLFKNE